MTIVRPPACTHEPTHAHTHAHTQVRWDLQNKCFSRRVLGDRDLKRNMRGNEISGPRSNRDEFKISVSPMTIASLPHIFISFMLLKVDVGETHLSPLMIRTTILHDCTFEVMQGNGISLHNAIHDDNIDSLAFSALLASLTRSAALICSLARSRTHFRARGKVND